MRKQKKLDIVIVNWNSGRQLYNCLKSIEKNESFEQIVHKIIIVDNASTDDSLAGIETLKLPLYVVRNVENKGYAYACNQGANLGQADYILFLNPDMELFQNSLIEPVSFLEKKSNQKVGIVGIQLVDENGQVVKTCGYFPTPLNLIIKSLGLNKLSPSLFKANLMEDWDHKRSRVVEQVIGAYFLVRRYLFRRLNGFDPIYFVYYEEVDFSLRVKELGYYSFYLTSASAYHRGGGSSDKCKDKRLFYNLKSRILYCFKHFGYIEARLVTFFTLAIEFFARIGFASLVGDFNNIMITKNAYKLLWEDLGNIKSIIKDIQ